MTDLSTWIVHQPINILVVGVLFAGLYFVLRSSEAGKGRRPTLLLIPAVGWGLYAAWEWLVMTASPEADIRVDLLLIVPVIFVVSIGCLAAALYPRTSRS